MLRFKIDFDLISISFSDIKYLTRSRLPDKHAECKSV